MNTFEIERFHHFDGVRHIDYTPQVGDIVNVVNDIVGIDTNGNAYTLNGSNFWKDNVVQIIAVGDDTMTVDDQTSSSPVVIVHAPIGAFEDASYFNKKFFKPYVTTTKVIDNVVTGVENAATVASSLINGIGSHITAIIVVAVIIGALVLYANFKKAL